MTDEEEVKYQEMLKEKKSFSTVDIASKALSLNNSILSALLTVPTKDKYLYRQLFDTIDSLRDLMGTIDIYNDVTKDSDFIIDFKLGGEEECQSSLSQEQEQESES